MGKTTGQNTLTREMRDPLSRAAFEKERAALEVSEFMAKKMAEQKISVRSLAARSGISSTVIQGIKSGKRKNIEYTTLRPLVHALRPMKNWCRRCNRVLRIAATALRKFPAVDIYEGLPKTIAASVADRIGHAKEVLTPPFRIEPAILDADRYSVKHW